MSEKESIYIETSIPSYAAARTSTSAVIFPRQITTRLFWERERQDYDLYVSDYVIEECKRGDKEASQRRLKLIEGIEIIPKTEKIEELAAVYRDILDIPHSFVNVMEANDEKLLRPYC